MHYRTPIVIAISALAAIAAFAQTPPTPAPSTPTAPPASPAPAARPQQPAPPPSLPTGQPMADVNLMVNEGSAVFSAQWRYSDAKLVEVPFNDPAPPGAERGAVGPANVTYDISPRAGEANFDDSAWPVIAADTLGQRRAGGKVCFNWYRVTLTMPKDFGGLDVAGSVAVLNATIDDYAEIWVNGQLPRALNQANPNLVTGFNTPNRVVLSNNVKPGEKVQVAIFGINGPISAAPTNYIWFREAKVEFFAKSQN